LDPIEEVSRDGASIRRSAITRGEQVVVSVVIAATPVRAGGRPGTEVVDETDSPPLPLTLEELASGGAAADGAAKAGLARTERAESSIAALGSLARFGARVERLADGAVIATLQGTGAATDQAAQAARCALSLRRILVDSTIVLTTGSAVFAGRIPVGPVIE